MAYPYNKVVVKSGGVEKEVECDSVLLAMGFKGKNNLAEALMGKGKRGPFIGDCAENHVRYYMLFGKDFMAQYF